MFIYFFCFTQKHYSASLCRVDILNDLNEWMLGAMTPQRELCISWMIFSDFLAAWGPDLKQWKIPFVPSLKTTYLSPLFWSNRESNHSCLYSYIVTKSRVQFHLKSSKSLKGAKERKYVQIDNINVHSENMEEIFFN